MRINHKATKIDVHFPLSGPVQVVYWEASGKQSEWQDVPEFWGKALTEAYERGREAAKVEIRGALGVTR